MKTTEELVQILESRGFKTKKDSSKINCHYHVDTVGRFSVYIYIGKNIRVLIETSGTKKYFIILAEVSFSRDAEIDTVIKQFNSYIEAVKEFDSKIEL